MELSHVTFSGPPIDEESAIIASLPDNLLGLLRQVNGFILYHGGLHVRGVCASPDWHSLSSVLAGPSTLHKDYPGLRASDIPFAQDCMADQYLLRDRKVHKLWAETGEVEALGLSLREFFEAVGNDPVGFLSMQPLLSFQADGGQLLPGQVLMVYPPYCSEQAADGVSLRAVPNNEALVYLANLSQTIAELEPGQKLRVKVAP